MKEPWFRHAYRRGVADMHITEDDERFLTEFDPPTYVNLVKQSRCQATVIYANSHVGFCYFPTKIGPMHRGLKGRDILGEVIELCHREEIAAVVYFSLIYDTHAYRHHPDWRIIRADGLGAADSSRYGVCCPNSPYRDYAAGIVAEICQGYELDGIRFDMTFWPRVCYCRHCQARFAGEIGGELPRVVDWHDPRWVRFQRKREEWLAEFALYQTSVVRKRRPAASVEHQASTYMASWQRGVSEQLVAANDFLQGDFYGDALQGSVIRKLFANLSPNQPFGFETCYAVDLRNYTAPKSPELLRAKSYAALADGGAFVFIDTIDPVGTVNPSVYAAMGAIFGETRQFEPYIGGEPAQDVAVYFSAESKGDFADNGKPVDDPRLSSRSPHVEAVVSTCKTLIDNHIPFGVISRCDLDTLEKHQVIVLPNVLMMSETEVAALRAYVRAGGSIYASKNTSLVTRDGRKQADFLLADLFGVSYAGETKERFTYIRPAGLDDGLFAGYSIKYPLGFAETQPMVRANDRITVLAKLTLPYTDPADPSRFAAIHHDPAGIDTENPTIVFHAYGSGKVIYVTADLENSDPHRSVFLNLLKRLAGPFSFEAVAPKSVEVTVRDQRDRRRLVVSLVNFQKELPNIPVSDVRVRIRLAGKTVRRLLSLPDELELHYELNDDNLEFIVPRIETFAMVALDYV